MMSTFMVYDIDGVPATSVVGLAFTSYYLSDGSVVAPINYPAISELGVGRYGFSPLSNSGWAVIDTSGLAPGYVGVNLQSELESFMLFDENGIPLVGAAGTAAFIQCTDANNVAIAEPPILEVGGGWYTIKLAIGSRYVIETNAVPAYVESQIEASSVPTQQFNPGWN